MVEAPAVVYSTVPPDAPMFRATLALTNDPPLPGLVSRSVPPSRLIVLTALPRRDCVSMLTTPPLIVRVPVVALSTVRTSVPSPLLRKPLDPASTVETVAAMPGEVPLWEYCQNFQGFGFAFPHTPYGSVKFAGVIGSPFCESELAFGRDSQRS